MENYNLNSDGLTELNFTETIDITGGDTGYYGKGPDLQLMVERVGTVAHNVGDFFRGLFGL
ncbi:MAG: hypothetical protein K2X37_04665 [Chitinophagaceae bacterium]|nr:hypothetical protein [Chitinophagaceae bacterium]